MMKSREPRREEEASWLVAARSARWTEEIAAGVFREQQAEGSSLWAFCQRYGLSYARVRFWRQRQGGPAPVSFVPVRVRAEEEPGGGITGGVELEVSGVRVQVPEGVSEQLLVRVVRALRESARC
ncbi:IS66 family insertion sequence element accessory protein TnpA [Hyalangium gracile]|uniref:IS66 family insertion sequence element accessory protein TnpA n=1 Tax=Hyalangium gracile TaxID=394092 RepID=UPI001CC9E85F|nr:transposase [Hyalangium gracile]